MFQIEHFIVQKWTERQKQPPLITQKARTMASKGSKYETFVKDAIVALKERTGSSLQAIKKYISLHNKEELKGNWESQLSQSLKRLTASGKLVKVISCGDSLTSPFKGASWPVVRSARTL